MQRFERFEFDQRGDGSVGELRAPQREQLELGEIRQLEISIASIAAAEIQEALG